MEIVIYDSRSRLSEPISTEVPIIPASGPIAVVHESRRSSRTLNYLGRGFLFLACVGILFAGLPAIVPKIQSEIRPKAKVKPVQTTFEEVLKRQKQQEEEEKEQEELRRKLAAEEAAKYGVETDFSIVIPKISAAAKVVPNIDPANEEEYRNALKSGVAHAKGSSFPSASEGTIYLFAHSTNSLANVSVYNAVFYELKSLEPGDKIIIFFAGQKHIYQVLEQKIIEANDVSWLTDQSGENGSKLVLQTCWPPGTSLKRLIVIAKQV